MTTWNVSLRQRQFIIMVKEVLERESKFMIILDSQKRAHKLSAVDFPSFDWEKIEVGSTITLRIKEEVKGWKVQPPVVKRSVEKLVAEVNKKVSGLFFIWVCEHCRTNGYVAYEDGDDPQIIAGHVFSAHQKEADSACQQKIRIFDHRGVEQKDSAFVLSSRRIE